MLLESRGKGGGALLRHSARLTAASAHSLLSEHAGKPGTGWELPTLNDAQWTEREEGDYCGRPLEVEVYTGELTEAGFSMLHWGDGIAAVFPALLRGCFAARRAECEARRRSAGAGSSGESPPCACCAIDTEAWRRNAAGGARDALAAAATQKRRASDDLGAVGEGEEGDGGDVRDRKHTRFD